MSICNPLTNRTISEINADLEKSEMEFYKRDDAKLSPDKDIWEVLDEGMRKIEESSTKDNMFKRGNLQRRK